MSPTRAPYSGAEAAAARARVLELRDRAVHALGAEGGMAWLFREHTLLAGVEPAGAAWYSARLARYAAALLDDAAGVGDASP